MALYLWAKEASIGVLISGWWGVWRRVGMATERTLTLWNLKEKPIYSTFLMSESRGENANLCSF